MIETFGKPWMLTKASSLPPYCERHVHMDFRDFISKRSPRFDEEIRSAGDLNTKVLLPYLYKLGYSHEEPISGKPLEVKVGAAGVTIQPDLEILVDGSVQALIHTKSPTSGISERDILQSEICAKLASDPPAIYGIVTNGIDCICTNVFTGRRTADIPSRDQLLRDAARIGDRTLTEVKLREVRRALRTLLNKEDLYKVIERCKSVIEKRGLIRADRSFREMTKILLVKMSEERRAAVNDEENRFSVDWIKATARASQIDEIEVFAR
ncbi:hypothetical protein ACFL2Q_17470 [Thermodesulfobacteriota bacterium]